MPTARAGLATGVIDGKLYAVGGTRKLFTYLSTLERYDPTTDTWEHLANMPTARVGLAAGVLHGKLYVVGGEGVLNNRMRVLPVLERYDPATDTWERLSDMPTARADLAAGVIDGKLYVVGGDEGGVLGALGVLAASGGARLERYDPATDTRERLDDMPTRRKGLAAAVIGNQLYALGGMDMSWISIGPPGPSESRELERYSLIHPLP